MDEPLIAQSRKIDKRKRDEQKEEMAYSVLARIDNIRARLERLNKSHCIQLPGPPIAVEILQDFEAKAGITIPDEFRYFFLEIGPGGSGPGRGLLQMKDWDEAIMEPTPGILALPCPLDPKHDFDDYANVADPAQGTLTIVTGGNGSLYTLLVVSGPNRGKLVRYNDNLYECSWIERARPLGPASFLDWYEGWLDLIEAHEITVNYGDGLIGSQEELTQVFENPSLPEQIRNKSLFSLCNWKTLTQTTLQAVHRIYSRGSNRMRARALHLIENQQSDPTVFLVNALQDPSKEVRIAAIWRLSKNPSPNLVQKICDMIDEFEDKFAESAFNAISKSPFLEISTLAKFYQRHILRIHVVIALSRFATIESLAILAVALQDPNPLNRKYAAHSIGKLKLPAGVSLLQNAQNTEQDSSVQKAITRALQQLLSSPT